MLTVYQNRTLSACTLLLVGALLLGSFATSSATLAQEGAAYVRQVRVLDDLDIAHPAGLAFSPEAEVLLVVEARAPAPGFDILRATLVEDRVGSIRIAASITNPINMAFDGKAQRLLFLQSARSNLFEVRVGSDGHLDPTTLRPYDARRFGLEDPQGLTVDPGSGDLFILDSAGPRLVRVTPDAAGGFDQAVVSEVDLGQSGLVGPRGVAFDPTTGHLHVMNPAQPALYEVTATGQVVAVRGLTGIALGESQGMVFAPSGDLTDDPAETSLYIADSGQTGAVIEMSFIQPAAPAAADFASTLVQTIDTSQWSPPSPDPSGITYLVISNTLLVSDAEVEETIDGITHFAGANLFEATLTGTLVYTANISKVEPTEVPMTNEPSGVTFNPDNGHLFFSDDDADAVYELDPGTDGRYGTSDDGFTWFGTSAFDNNDPEGIALGQGNLFVSDGVNREVYQYTPAGSLVGQFDVAGIGLQDPEGIDYNSVDGTLLIVDHGTDMVAETTISGTAVLMIDISAANAVHVSGVAYAPGSVDPGVMSLYIADRKVNNDADPNENDGKVYEMSAALPPVVVFSHATYNVDEGPGTATITVDLFRRSSSDTFSVDYTTSNGTATADDDYTAASGTLIFDPGETSKTFSVPILEDALDEANETVNLTLSNPTNGAELGATAVAILTINDNDNPPSVQFDGSAYNVDEAAGTATITATLSAASGLTVTVDYATSDGTATAGSDYTTISDTLAFDPGQTSQTFSVPITDDTLDETNETVNLTLSNPGNAALGVPAGATLTIVDNDAPPTVQLSSSVYSVNEGGSTATITVTLNAASGLTVTVDYATSDDTATAGSDYTASSGPLTFNPGQTSKTFSVPILEDALDEANETVNLTLSNPGNATLGTASATLVIVDNDALPSVQFSAANFSEAESGGTATITVFLSPASGRTVTVDYAASDGTATAGSDYTAVGDTLTFDPGQTIKTFSVPILEDALDEANETVNLTLSNFSNAVPGTPASAMLTIVDDDARPTVQFSSTAYSVNEGGSTATITVTLSAASGRTVSVDYVTSSGTATIGSDYTATSGPLTFNPGQTSQTFSVPITDDTLDETNETVNLILSNPGNATLGAPAEATLTIVDDDAPPTVQLSSTAYSVNEGGSTAIITVTLNAASGLTVTVDYATSDGAATAGSDYTPTSGTLTFNPGQTSKTFSVPITDDTFDEPDETVNLTLSNPGNATLGTPASATLTIVDNDGLPSVQFSDSAYGVAEAGGAATITVTLSAASGQSVMVDYATNDGTAATGSDYTAISGTLTFDPGQTSKTFSVPITDDTLDEPDETVNLTLSNPGNATLGTLASAILTIVEDDPVRIYLPLVSR